MRPSLAPSESSDGKSEYIIESIANAATGPDIECDVVPARVGRHCLAHSGNISWGNMSSITDGLTVAPQLDLYSGTRIGDTFQANQRQDWLFDHAFQLSPTLQRHHISSSKNKGPSGSLEVVKRQAAHGVATAARLLRILGRMSS